MTMTENTNTLYSPFYQGLSNIPIGIAVARKREDLKKDDSGKLVILTAFVILLVTILLLVNQ
jgi:hypothetical protein